MRRTAPWIPVLLLMAACQHAGQDTYGASEVGVSKSVEFGTVVNRRNVEITGKNTETGALLGAGVGAGGGSYVGGGSGNAWATAGAAVLGAVAGHYAEQALSDRDGIEYTVQLQSGEVKTIVQEKNATDPVFTEGDPVMLQYCDAGAHTQKCSDGREYQRLLPIKKLPPYVSKHRKAVTVYHPGENQDADVPNDVW